MHCKRGVHIRTTLTLEEFPLSERGYCFSEKSTEVIVVVHVRGAWQYRGVPGREFSRWGELTGETSERRERKVNDNNR